MPMVYVGNSQYREIIKLGAEPGEFTRQAIERELKRKQEAVKTGKAK